MKSFHTFFDYWMSTKTSMMKSGRVLYNWPKNEGGIPPTFDHIKDATAKKKVRVFVDALLGQHSGISKELKYIFAANGVRFFADFLKVLEDEPTGKFANKGLDFKKQNDMFTNKVRIQNYFVDQIFGSQIIFIS